MSQKFRWFEAILGKERMRDTGEGDPHMYVSYSMLVAWIVITNGWYGHDPGEFISIAIAIGFGLIYLMCMGVQFQCHFILLFAWHGMALPHRARYYLFRTSY